jgi:uncharacterized protein
MLAMHFDFDAKKSESNKNKHKIDFVEAQKIWCDPDAIKDVPDNYKAGEQYWLAVGEVNSEIWTAIYNLRGIKKDIIHLVSVRKARDYEREQYEILKN